MKTEQKNTNARKTNSKNSFSSIRLKPSEIRWTCPTKFFKFKTTASLPPLDEIVGQPRAIEAIRLGAELKSTGYNIFVSGLAGTGRLTTVQKILEKLALQEPELYDLCYVNDFQSPDTPRLVRLPKGQGKVFVSSMADAITYLRTRMPKLFEDDNFKNERKNIIGTYQQKEHNILKNFDNKIAKESFIRGQVENEQGNNIQELFFVVENEPYSIENLNELIISKKISKADAEEIFTKYTKFKNELQELGNKHLKLMQDFRKKLIEHDKSAVSMEVRAVMEGIKEKFNNDKVNIYANEVIEYILANIPLFVSMEQPPEAAASAGSNNSSPFNLFKVNLILDNSTCTQPPIIAERNPSITNLFGTIERTIDPNGFWKTDFTKIKAGSLLKADGGFLIVNAADLLEEPGAWQALKRVLLYNRLEIQTYESMLQFSQIYIKPEPIKVNVKVIIIGGLTLYKLLYEYEKGFNKIFKINAQFDYETTLTQNMIDNYAKFANKICTEEGIAHCTPSGVAALVEWAVEHSGSRDKISLKFSDVADIIRESAYYDKYSTKKYIDREDVEKAIEMRRFRNNLWDEKMKDSILDGTILIDVTGRRVGQINGLTVMDDGLLSFGKPARITATVSAGSVGIINIEREADLSGSIHNKGVLIITNFIRDRFSKKKPLTLTASIAFEQSYGGIDGDSASAAEIYVLVSALLNQPINQNIALTGSMNQRGDIQPIGGVNEKITGFYEICKIRGLTGEQGVLIPLLNVKDLMLRKDIIEDVRKKQFHIYTFSKIEEGFELIMNLKAGTQDANGNYTEGSAYALITKRLDELALLAQAEKKEIKS